MAKGEDGNYKGSFTTDAKTDNYGSASNHEFTISGGTFGSVYGGKSNTQDAKNNSVTITGGTINDNFYGGYSDNNSTGNSVIITGGTTKSNFIMGGCSQNGSATGNSVIITKGNIHSTVYGGVSNSGSAADNSVTLGSENDTSGVANVKGNVYINLGTNPSTDGTLNVYNSGNKIGSDLHADGANVKFYINAGDMNTAGSNIMLKVGEIAHITGATINAGVRNIGYAQKGSKIILLQAKRLEADDELKTGVLTDGLLVADLTIELDNTNHKIIATAGKDAGTKPSTGGGSSGSSSGSSSNGGAGTGTIIDSTSVTTPKALEALLANGKTSSLTITDDLTLDKEIIIGEGSADNAVIGLKAGKSLKGNKTNNGIGLAVGKTLHIKGEAGSKITNFATAFVNNGTLYINPTEITENNIGIENTATGSLNLENVTINGNNKDVINNGVMNLTAVNTIGTIEGNGTTNLQSGTTDFVKTIQQTSFNVAEGATANFKNGTGSEVGSLNAQNANLNFYISPSDMNEAGTNTMLKVTGNADVSNANIKAGILNTGIVADGSKINLITAGTLKADGATMGAMTVSDGIMEKTLKVEQSGNSITAAVPKQTDSSAGGTDNGSDTDNIITSPNAKSPVETMAANIALLNAGSDMLAGQGMDSASDAASNADSSMMPFACVGGGSLKLNSGSYVDLKSWNINVGFAKEIKNDNGKLMFGPVIEYGRGSYDSHLDNGTTGNGKSGFLGVGMMAKQTFNNGTYVEGSARIGRVKSDYNSVLNGHDEVSYDNSTTYYAMHLGLGRKVALNETDTFDYYGKLFYSHQNGSTAHLSNSYDYDFAATDSFRTRLGFRYTHQMNDFSKFFAGLAWQREFSSSCNATLRNNLTGISAEAPAPGMAGNTGILELGVKLKPNKSDKFEVDLGLAGYTGKQQGVTANAQFLFRFN